LAREYLQRREAEAEQDLLRSGRLHWDLWLMDGRKEDAFFAVLVFWPSPRGLEFFCGTGDSLPVRAFCEGDAPDNPVKLFKAMRQRFTIPQGRLQVNRAAAERWLGRGW
jgi:hypothetical protein